MTVAGIGYTLLYFGLMYELIGILLKRKKILIWGFYTVAVGSFISVMYHGLNADLAACKKFGYILCFAAGAPCLYFLFTKKRNNYRGWTRSFFWAEIKVVFIALGVAFGLLSYWKVASWREMKKLMVGRASARANIVVISIDGGRPDTLRNAPARNILELCKRGAWTFDAQTIFPSYTGPGHMSMGTGLTPEHHGVRVNRFRDMTPGDKASIVARYKSGKIKTIVDYAKVSRGMRTILVISKTSDFQEELRTFLGLRNLDVLDAESEDAFAIVERASSYLTAPEPLLLLIHFKEVDEAGHEHGWMSQEQFAAARMVDEAIGRLLQHLAHSPKRGTTYVLINADHGGHTEYRADGSVSGVHGSNRREDMTIPWILVGPDVKRGYQIKFPVNVCDTTPTVLHILGIPVPEEMDGHPVLDAFK